MATATQKDLLREARRVDNAQADKMNQLALAVKEQADSLDESVEPHPLNQLKLDDDSDDPFNGNLNNRRVAARIARRIEVSSGDPHKAKEDVERSLRINPEPVIKTGDELPEIKLVHDTTGQPTPGSPADLKHGKSQTQMGGHAPTGEQSQASNAAENKGEAQGKEEAKATGTEGKAAGKGKNPPQWKNNAS